VTAASGNIYGCGTTGASVTLATAAALTPDGTNYQCTAFSGIGASLSANNTWTGTNAFGAQVTSTPVALSGTTVAVNAALGNVFTLTLTGATTISNPTGMVAGQTMTFMITQASGGGDTVTWSGNYKWPAGTPPTMTSTANAVDMQTCIAASSSVCRFGPAAQDVR
jgi:hypothetical protein